MKVPVLRHIAPELHVAVLAIVCLSALEGYALYKGLNGTMFGLTAAGIGSIIGWVFKSYIGKKE